MFIKRTPSIQVGLWLRHHAIDVVWFDKDNRPHSECLEKLDLLELPATLNRRLAMPASYLAKNTDFAAQSHPAGM